MDKRRKGYSDPELVKDIAGGELTQAQMAEKHGLAEVTIGQIARGERRPLLQAKIRAAVQGMEERARRLGSRLAEVAMARLGALVAKDSEASDGVQHKAAVDILKFALGDPSRPEVSVTQSQQPAPGLTPAILKKIGQVQGGPPEDPPEEPGEEAPAPAGPVGGPKV